MPATLVVDASVVVEFLAASSDSADRLMRGLGWPTPLDLLAPDLLYAEAANTFRKLALRKAISTEGADRAVSKLSQLPIGSAPTRSLIDRAWEFRHQLTLYDAVYVALASTLECALVTADRALSRACAGLGVRVLALDGEDLRELLDALEPRR